MHYIILSLFSILSLTLFSQNEIQFQVLDNETSEALIGANIFSEKLDRGELSDLDGMAAFANVPNGKHNFVISYIGYETQEILVDLPADNQKRITVKMQASTATLDEVIVSATRANRSISRTPTRIEVLTDEVEEAATMDPSKIAHLLMHTTGVQIQQTSASSGAARVRIQGQYGRYTQILKDGFPLYGGFTGALGVLQIPPLDLKQVEFIKGSSSTLYGGGAIAGLINLVSREPGDEPEFSVHMNLSHIGNRDINAFYSGRKGKWGVTLFGSSNVNSVFDADDDNWSDVPEVSKTNFNPKVIYYLSDRTRFSLAATITQENRLGGDVEIVKGLKPETSGSYFERNTSDQFTTQFIAEHKLGANAILSLKNSTNQFDRIIELPDYIFDATQFSNFSEVSLSVDSHNSNLVAGLNLYADEFDETAPINNNSRDQSLLTLGAFGQWTVDWNRNFSLESGLRIDHNSDYGSFFLPRLALMYRAGLRFNARVAFGMGYNLPRIFTEEAETLAFESVLAIDKDVNIAEESMGFNTDFTYALIMEEEFSLNITQSFFYNRLDNPLLLNATGNGNFQLLNSTSWIRTRGMETLLKGNAGHFHIYLGYTYVDAELVGEDRSDVLPLTPKHSFHGDLMYIKEGKWRMGIDAEYESTQVLMSGRRVRDLFKAGFLMERSFSNLSVYINLENWTDTRQTKYESIVQEPFDNPRFTEVWAPLDGFIFNTGVKLKL